MVLGFEYSVRTCPTKSGLIGFIVILAGIPNLRLEKPLNKFSDWMVFDHLCELVSLL